MAIFFAVGAVSGTALSFELGLLWPNFMKHAGPIIGMPFFLEAIALGLFLYGWERMPRWAHWASGPENHEEESMDFEHEYEGGIASGGNLGGPFLSESQLVH